MLKRSLAFTLVLSGCFGSHRADDDIVVPDGGARWTECYDAFAHGSEGDPCDFAESCGDVITCDGEDRREVLCLGGQLRFFERTCTIAWWETCEDYLGSWGHPGDACGPSFGECFVTEDACCARAVRCEGGLVTEQRECRECLDLCPEYMPPPPELAPCRSGAECESGFSCLPPGSSPGCGVCVPAERACEGSADCPDGTVCEEHRPPCSCDGPSSACVPHCTTIGCEPGERCGGDGLCSPIACSAGYVCPLNTRCGSGTNVDEHGCARLGCASDIECDCGACVEGYCESGPGVCRPPAP